MVIDGVSVSRQADAARALGVSRQRVQQLIAKEQLEVVVANGERFVVDASLYGLKRSRGKTGSNFIPTGVVGSLFGAIAERGEKDAR